MEAYTIRGGNILSGEVLVQGSKNAALPLMAAAVVNDGVTVLHNCPDISDVRYMAEILEYLGCVVEYKSACMSIDASTVEYRTLPEYMIKQTRASILMLGALIARKGYVELSYPGGCNIGARPVDFHLEAFRRLGVEVVTEDEKISCHVNKPVGNEIKFRFPSVGATENAILAACRAKGVTTIHNAAKEPEIIELCELLSSMGVSVKGSGTSVISIMGTDEFRDVVHHISSDRIVAGTYLCAGTATGGRVRVKVNNLSALEEMNKVFYKMGCRVTTGNDYCDISAPDRICAVDVIETRPYPGFPTDMQSQFLAVLSVAEGQSIIVENIFEARFRVACELNKMGADIIIDGNKATVNGVKSLNGATVTSKELRGGAALIIAGLEAEGVTCVQDEGYIKRGYENIVEIIAALGGNISCDRFH